MNQFERSSPEQQEHEIEVAHETALAKDPLETERRELERQSKETEVEYWKKQNLLESSAAAFASEVIEALVMRRLNGSELEREPTMIERLYEKLTTIASSLQEQGFRRDAELMRDAAVRVAQMLKYMRVSEENWYDTHTNPKYRDTGMSMEEDPLDGPRVSLGMRGHGTIRVEGFTPEGEAAAARACGLLKEGEAAYPDKWQQRHEFDDGTTRGLGRQTEFSPGIIVYGSRRDEGGLRISFVPGEPLFDDYVQHYAKYSEKRP